jgi:hypothetical protein
MSIHRWAALLVLSVLLSAHADDHHGDKETTLRGEIVDLGRFLSAGKRGMDHKPKSEASIRGGAPAALVTADGAVYVLLYEEPDSRAPLNFVAHTVEVKGIVHERGGARGIVCSSVQDLGEAPTPQEGR